MVRRLRQRMSVATAALAIASIALVTAVSVGAAFAHDPIILTDTQTTPEAGPLLPDGTISFALYGTLLRANDSRGVRAQFVAGDAVDVTLLIPDRAPENALADAALPTLTVEAPDGSSRTLTPTERVQFDESFSKTSYVRYLELHEPAQAGEYRFTVAGTVPARFTLAIGVTEQFGTPVENVPNRADGSKGVARWYDTPPAAPAPTTVPPTTVPPTMVPPTTVPPTTVPPTTVPPSTVLTTEVPTTTAPPTTEPATTVAPTTLPAPSGDGGGSSTGAIVVGALVVVAAGLGWFLWQRRRRPS